MTKKDLFEILLRVLGAYLLFTALTAGMTTAYTYYHFKDITFDPGWQASAYASTIGYFYLPFFFGLGLLAGGKRIASFWVGSGSAKLPDLSPQGTQSLFHLLLKLLGAYFAISSGSNLVATMYQLAAYQYVAQDVTKQQINADFIYCALSTAIGCWLVFGLGGNWLGKRMGAVSTDQPE